MQSFVVTIRRIAGMKNKEEDQLSWLEQHYLEEANSYMDLLEEDIECLLFHALEFDEVDIDTPMANYEKGHNIIELELEQEIDLADG